MCPIQIPSHPASAIIHIQYKPSQDMLSPPPSATRVAKNSNPASLAPRNPCVFDIELEERLLQDVIDESINQGVLIAKVHRLRGQELLEPRPSIRVAVTSSLSRKEVEKAAGILRNALTKVLGKRR